jgi:predicted N-acyltransferase
LKKNQVNVLDLLHSMNTQTLAAPTLKPLQKESDMDIKVNQAEVKIYSAFEELDEKSWKSMIDNTHRFICPEYLKSMEASHDEGLDMRFAMVYSGEILLGVMAFQITHFTTSDEAYSSKLLKFLNQTVRLFRSRHVHNILICGNAFATGEHGFKFLDAISAEKKADFIHRAMRKISKLEKRRGKRICAMLIKDFYPRSNELAEKLTDKGYKSFQVDHNMVMPVNPSWKTFENYLDDLNTKFRTKAKSALAKSGELEVLEPEIDALIQHNDRIKELYNNVYVKADFRLGKFNLSTISELKKNMGDHFQIRTYSHEGKLVGFSTAMICGEILEAHTIGIDYEVNRDLAVYQRMLYDFVETGIREKCNRIVFGRTAEEIKSTIGAYPVDLTCCMARPRRISNALLSLILQYVKPTEYPQRQPYKAASLEQINKLPLY